MMKVALLSLCFIITGCDQLGNGAPPQDDLDHFQLAVDSKGDAWVLDTRTGESKKCWQGNAGSNPPTCYTAIKK